MSTYQKEIDIETTTQFELVNITSAVKDALKKSRVREGIVTIFSPHTTASIRINHDEPLLKQDLMKFIYRLVPMDMNYAHDFFEIRSNPRPDERSNGHAHVKAFLLGQSESVPVDDGVMRLGERESIFFVEFDGGRKRKVIIKIIGE